MDRLSMSVQYVKGVGPKRASKLRKLNIHTVEDLIYYFPRSYEDRRNFSRIRDCSHGQKVSLKVYVAGYPSVLRPRKNLSILKVPVKDETGIAYLIWFNQDYLADKFNIGEELNVNGKIKRIGNEVQISNPVFEKKNSYKDKVGSIVPIYSLTENLTNNEMVLIMKNVLKDYIDKIVEIFPKDMLSKLDLMPVKQAILNVHFPKNGESYKRARERLVFEELLVLQLGLFMIKNNVKFDNLGIKFDAVEEVEDFISRLPFQLTNAQKKVFKEIEKDMESDKQMNRLIQGDVGSGKTVIAALAMFKAWKSGYQSAMMAPTEILASQHYENISHMMEKYGMKCELLVGSLSNKKKEEVLDKLKNGEIDILVGTHAIIQDNVQFKNLGLAITDEQHRFGVRQRAIFSQKGLNPDIIVMTATPIPRTLALILYGDLDISIIDELPPGRKAIETYAVGFNMLGRVNEFVKKQIREGRQAYIVCPLIEESDTLNIRAALEIYDKFKDETFTDFKVGLLHGKMKADEKDNIMNKFKDGKIDILVSTTVIEVGVNVPNANIMVIYNAERFGLSQLHQLRGRVGRGEYQSYCILINEGNNKVARERMRIMQKTNDGFKISEKDLELRGPGEFFGTRQHGLPDLKIANLFTDMEILKLAQSEASKIILKDPHLKDEEYCLIREKIKIMFKDKIDDIIFN
ncbi:ATP-dependent DNA helicase RecG [Sporanaerobacter acetigenes]|uniref:ATP-dependent DNA helicase RecG n=1 Tax=Sporanaerobacter acetigenes DSM 13106 TaxID=1123281 RepID=A0A1M5XXW3_9FIRM|nr:ATP-dependent DNA helicase RecG [Sporanaerobacter acetigenes]SHI04529.1 ATP-dependent DNA helicase RecG [Sporanaerobacter acetigenes DSM 13106]